ncbi:MAG TPA: hypothetical protein VK880_06615 [Anaerolineales bacterium]|nr:hypothetical protein [Anaerolineales bacterium]
MKTANSFYKMLTETPPGKDPYRDTLAAVTRSTRPQLIALSSDLAWQTWDAEGKPQHK